LIITGEFAYYIHLDFAEPLQLQEKEKENFISVGSSVQLLSELDELNKYLKMDSDFELLGDKGVYKLICEYESDQWRFVKWTWTILHWLARQSVARQLCIYFE